MYPRCSCANTQHQTRKLEYVLARAMKNKKIVYTTIIYLSSIHENGIPYFILKAL